MPGLVRGYGALRRGRYSAPDTDYFLTICLRRPTWGFSHAGLREQCIDTMRHLEGEEIWIVRSAVVMPDHLHMLAMLRRAAELSDAVRLFKGRLSPALRKQGVRWQPNFYDHRMRADEDRLPVFLYMYLNPYRAGLVAGDQPWAGYLCSEHDWQWFGKLTNEPCPQPEWLH